MGDESLIIIIFVGTQFVSSCVVYSYFSIQKFSYSAEVQGNEKTLNELILLLSS